GVDRHTNAERGVARERLVEADVAPNRLPQCIAIKHGKPRQKLRIHRRERRDEKSFCESLCVLRVLCGKFRIPYPWACPADSNWRTSSPVCQTSPAPSVMKMSPGESRAAAARARSARAGTWDTPRWPCARIASTRRADETPAIGSSPAA